MVSVDQDYPTDVVDRQLWRDARDIVRRHVVTAAGEECECCGRPWPCATRRLGERAEMAASQPWDEAWTMRHDLRSLRATAEWRPGAHIRTP